MAFVYDRFGRWLGKVFVDNGCADGDAFIANVGAGRRLAWAAADQLLHGRLGFAAEGTQQRLCGGRDHNS